MCVCVCVCVCVLLLLDCFFYLIKYGVPLNNFFGKNSYIAFLHIYAILITCSMMQYLVSNRVDRAHDTNF